MKQNIANLLKVKTIITLVMTGVFATLALTQDISSEMTMAIITMVFTYYFQKDKGEGNLN